MTQTLILAITHIQFFGLSGNDRVQQTKDQSQDPLELAHSIQVVIQYAPIERQELNKERALESNWSQALVCF